MPDAPSPQEAAQATPAAISGTVMDASGAVVMGAAVTLENTASGEKRLSATSNGGVFSFVAVDPGSYKVTITAKGFAPWTSAPIIVNKSETYVLPSIVLVVAGASSDVLVTPSRYEIAEEQLKAEEKQRLLGVFPEFYVSYIWNAAPLTAKQKFKLAWKDSTDPVSFSLVTAVAGYEQARDNLRDYGQGMEGFGKRFGANYADSVSWDLIGGAILPSVLHQDPRYFIKGTGSNRSRALHAMEFPFICRGDDGRSQPNFSSLGGTFASAEISKLYLPSSTSKNATGSNILLGIVLSSVTNLITEFVFPHVTTSIPKQVVTTSELILRAGTPVSLVATQDLNAENAEKGKSVAFSLSRDLAVNGVTVAKAGVKVSGEVIGVAKPGSNGKEGELDIRLNSFFVGADEILLRASKGIQTRNDVSHEPSGKAVEPGTTIRELRIQAGTALTVYVAQDVTLHIEQ
jgi:hypothetical protein